MSIITQRGTLFPYQQTYTEDFDPTRGIIYKYDFTGFGQTQIRAFQQDFIRAGIACRLTFHNTGRNTLDVDDSTQQFTLDTWEIVGNEEHVDGLSHPIITAIMPDALIAQLRSDLDDNTSPSDLNAALIQGGISAENAAIVTQFYSLQQRGSTEYRRGQYVLRHTTNAPNRWQMNISDVGVDQIYSMAQLLIEAQSTALWAFPLPARLVYKLNLLPPPQFQTNYLWGWLKSASTETTSANNRINITTEYTLEQWSVQPAGYYAPKT